MTRKEVEGEEKPTKLTNSMIVERRYMLLLLMFNLKFDPA